LLPCHLSTAAEPHSFQAETLSLLDIVSNALYTEREVFLRELLSNASDALEKLRHRQVVGEPIGAPDVPLEIVIEADPEANTLTIADTGIGMGKDELILNLGTIARSGSKNFVNSLQQQRDGGGGAAAARLRRSREAARSSSRSRRTRASSPTPSASGRSSRSTRISSTSRSA
jgi:hypothetical protein